MNNIIAIDINIATETKNKMDSGVSKQNCPLKNIN